jgi:hypothetical protein
MNEFTVSSPWTSWYFWVSLTPDIGTLAWAPLNCRGAINISTNSHSTSKLALTIQAAQEEGVTGSILRHVTYDRYGDCRTCKARFSWIGESVAKTMLGDVTTGPSTVYTCTVTRCSSVSNVAPAYSVKACAKSNAGLHYAVDEI